MIYIDFDAELKRIEERLGNLGDKAPNALRNALNTTARKIRKQIVKDARGQYVLKDKKQLQATKAMKMSNAKPSNLVATLRSSGSSNELMNFLVSPESLSRGNNAPAVYAAQVLKASGTKSLDGDPKPFVTQFQSGHIAIVERVPGKRMRSNPKKEALKKLLSPSVPHMLKNKDVQAKANRMLMEELPDQIEKQIQKILAQGGKR